MLVDQLPLTNPINFDPHFSIHDDGQRTGWGSTFVAVPSSRTFSSILQFYGLYSPRLPPLYVVVSSSSLCIQ